MGWDWKSMMATAACAALSMAGASRALADPVSILFVGDSFTHGRYPPALNYNAGPGNAPGGALVHDLLCPSLPCTGAEAQPRILPTPANTPGATTLGKLAFLQANPSAQYTEVGPFGGVAGIFLQLTREVGLDYDVSLVAVSSATLTGYANNSGNEKGDLSLITNPKFTDVVLQEQSFAPLPPTIDVNGTLVPTRSNPAGFKSSVTALIADIDAADRAAGRPLARIILAQTQALASYGYTSNNPSLPLFGISTPVQKGGNPAYAPYVGDRDPIDAMTSDLHAAYDTVASSYNAAYPANSHVAVSPDGDAWATAIRDRFAQRDPFLPDQAAPVDLWDGDPLLACCETPIGYHPSKYGAYLDALTLLGRITGKSPLLAVAEYDPRDRNYAGSASHALGISPTTALALAAAAAETLVADSFGPPTH